MVAATDYRMWALDKAVTRLRRGVLVHVAIAALLLVLGVLAALNGAPSLLDDVRGWLLVNYSGAADAAVLLLVLIALANISGLLVLLVGAQAYESWVLPGLALLIIANVALLILLGCTPSIVSITFATAAGIPLVRASGLLRSNPVMVRELRGRMRGARAYVVLTLYLALMGGFSLVLYLIFGAINAQSASSATGVVGRTLFTGVVAVQLLLIILIAPSFTAGAITGERERQTYDLVRTTLLTSPAFIVGKLESSLAYIVLLLLAAIPLQALAFLFGGIGQAELLLAFVILGVTAVAFGAVGIYFSASQTRTLSASVRTYAAIGVGAFLVPFVLLIILNALLNSTLVKGGATTAPALEAALHYVRLIALSLNPFTTALDTQTLLVEQQVWGVYSFTLASNGSTIPMISSWIPFSILYVALAALLIVLTIRASRASDLEA
jgi:ABC-2 type transport system permease protein